jgi:hypothetical protein
MLLHLRIATFPLRSDAPQVVFRETFGTATSFVFMERRTLQLRVIDEIASSLYYQRSHSLFSYESMTFRLSLFH